MLAVGGAGPVTAHLGPAKTCCNTLGDTSDDVNSTDICQEGKTNKNLFSTKNVVIKLQNYHNCIKHG